LRHADHVAVGELDQVPLAAVLVGLGAPVADHLADLAGVGSDLLVARLGDSDPVHLAPFQRAESGWTRCYGISPLALRAAMRRAAASSAASSARAWSCS